VELPEPAVVGVAEQALDQVLALVIERLAVLGRQDAANEVIDSASHLRSLRR
jgi:hypothetical protein